jgi:hypothetical protein
MRTGGWCAQRSGRAVGRVRATVAGSYGVVRLVVGQDVRTWCGWIIVVQGLEGVDACMQAEGTTHRAEALMRSRESLGQRTVGTNKETDHTAIRDTRQPRRDSELGESRAVGRVSRRSCRTMASDAQVLSAIDSATPQDDEADESAVGLPLLFKWLAENWSEGGAAKHIAFQAGGCATAQHTTCMTLLQAAEWRLRHRTKCRQLPRMASCCEQGRALPQQRAVLPGASSCASRQCQVPRPYALLLCCAALSPLAVRSILLLNAHR